MIIYVLKKCAFLFMALREILLFIEILITIGVLLSALRGILATCDTCNKSAY